MANKSPKNLTKLMCLRIDAETKAMQKRAKGLGISEVNSEVRNLIKNYLAQKLEEKEPGAMTLIPGDGKKAC